MRRLVTVLILAFFSVPATATVRVTEVARVQGVRDNQLVGYGLVVGLNRTGDRQQTFFTTQSLINMLDRLGVTVTAQSLRVENIAAVMVTAELPSFARACSRLDCTVSSIGDARSLQGGLLVQTPLKAANGQVYAVAQGSIVTGGFSAGNAANGVQV
ncbi:MAG TPA: flagellar basal body P-ring protein FlgI, partial [Terriglobia bacterium]|nr:flagellar basal body P-ring protein FlgI [Terriglobia bacterium]